MDVLGGHSLHVRKTKNLPGKLGVGDELLVDNSQQTCGQEEFQGFNSSKINYKVLKYDLVQ